MLHSVSGRRSLSWLLLSCVGLFLGCAEESNIKVPPLGQVRGNVTLDGDALADAQVEFVPANARSSTGKTDGDGNYVLAFDATRKGAAVGEHKVRIMTKIEAGPDKEQVPEKYNAKTELTRTVEEGENEIDFELLSK